MDNDAIEFFFSTNTNIKTNKIKKALKIKNIPYSILELETRNKIKVHCTCGIAVEQ